MTTYGYNYSEVISMNLKHLNYFVAIVGLKSFSKAAKKLHISQPSLSNAIQKMESELGFQLLERNTRNIFLTESGEILYKRALHILAEVDIVEKEMNEVALIGNGELQIGMIESAKHWIPKVIHRYNEQFPSMTIKLTEVLSGNAVKSALRKYETHAIITNQTIHEDDIETTQLYDEKLVLVMHKDHPLSNKQLNSLKELENEHFIISSDGFKTKEDVMKAFELEKIQPFIKYEIERFETALSLVRENLGVTLIPENYLLGKGENLVVSKTINSQLLKRTVYLTTMKNRYISPAVQAFIREVKNQFSS